MRDDDSVTPENMPIMGGLDVYLSSYYAKLIETLTGEFPVLSKLIGKNTFDSLARNYLDRYPPRDNSVRHVGKYLAEFLAQNKEVHPAHVELATFEWLFARAQSASEQTVFTLAALVTIPVEQWSLLTFLLHSSSYSLTCQFNSIEYWEKARDGNRLAAITELDTPITVVVWRQENAVRYRKLSTLEVILFKLLQARLTFASLCENILSHFTAEDEAVSWLSEQLKEWTQLGLFGKIA